MTKPAVFEIFGAEVDPTRDSLVRICASPEEALNLCKGLNSLQAGRHYVNSLHESSAPDSVETQQHAILRTEPDGTTHACRFETDRTRARAIADELSAWSQLTGAPYSYRVN